MPNADTNLHHRVYIIMWYLPKIKTNLIIIELSLRRSYISVKSNKFQMHE